MKKKNSFYEDFEYITKTNNGLAVVYDKNGRIYYSLDQLMYILDNPVLKDIVLELDMYRYEILFDDYPVILISNKTVYDLFVIINQHGFNHITTDIYDYLEHCAANKLGTDFTPENFDILPNKENHL